jgi:hypothetical protein
VLDWPPVNWVPWCTGLTGLGGEEEDGETSGPRVETVQARVRAE